ncbi:MAG TPA: hypothetical protein VHO66_08700 [Ruminiclostridium sp.]|nr:hypothetical protein [Ruminiclostridium sp.]
MSYEEALEDQKRLIKFRERHYYSAKTEKEEEEPEVVPEVYSDNPPDVQMKTINCYPL